MNFRQEKLNRIEEERMKSREIKVQLNKATRSDAEPSPRKTEDKEPEWVSKRKSVTVNAPVKIEKDIVFKEGKRRNTIESKLKLNRDSAVLKFRYLEDFFVGVALDPKQIRQPDCKFN